MPLLSEINPDPLNLNTITDEAARTMELKLDFLSAGKRYVAEIYADGPKAHFLDNPTPVSISSQPVTAATRLTLRLAAGGGQALRIRPAK